jgi:putative membrane protein
MTDPRILLAAERTLLAWIRTGIALMGFGFVVARFGMFLRQLAYIAGQQPPQQLNAGFVGMAVAGTGVVVNVWASLRHRRMVARLRDGATEIGSAGPVAVGLLSGIGGIIVIAVLVAAATK